MNIGWKPNIPEHLRKSSPPKKEPKKRGSKPKVVSPLGIVFKSNGHVDWENKHNLKKVASRLSSGMSCKEVALDLNLSQDSIRHCARRKMLPFKGKRKSDNPLTRADWDLIIALRVIKTPIADCAKVVGIHRSILSNLLHLNETARMIIHQKRKALIKLTIKEVDK